MKKHYYYYVTPKKRICPISDIRYYYVLLFMFLISCFPVNAQVNIFTGETIKKITFNPGLYNSINVDLAYRTGNTELLTLRSRFRSDLISKSYHTFIFGSLQQGKKDGNLFTNKGMVHGRFIRSLTNHILMEAFVQKQFNETILLKDRNLVGGGVRFAVRPLKSRLNLYLGTGTMWEHEYINDHKVAQNTTRIVRSTNYVNWTGNLDERITTSATGYYQVHVRDFEDYRILFEGSILFSLTKKLGFPLRVNFRYDNVPPTGIRKHDLEIFNGLSYTF